MLGHHTHRRLRVLRTLPALLLAALLLPGLVPDSAKAVTTAPRSTQMPWSVRLTFYTPSGAEGVCSGVVLTKHWIVTAAHCLHGRAKSTDQVRVDYGGSYRSTPLYAQGTASFYNHPDYDEIGFLKGDWGDDIGLVRRTGSRRHQRNRVGALGPGIAAPEIAQRAPGFRTPES